MTGVTGTTGVLLAAGAGRRAGGPKVLRRDADGTSWVARSLGVLLDGGCDEVVVVLGGGADEAGRLLETQRAGGRVRLVEAPGWAAGLSSSLVAGVTVVAEAPGRAALVHLVDLPDVSAAVVQRVLARAGATPEVLARATYAGEPGHPVLLGPAHLAPLLAHLTALGPGEADVGARGYLQRHGVVPVECGDLATGEDQDDVSEEVQDGARGEDQGRAAEPVRSTEGRTDGEQRG